MSQLQEEVENTRRRVEIMIGVANRDMSDIFDTLESDINAEFELLYEYAEPEDDE